MKKVTERVLEAIKNSPQGITNLDILQSLRMCNDFTLKTTLSRLNKAGKIIRLKRGTYSAKPLKDAFAAAQATFNGYIGFASALYLHRLISESPFVITVVTTDESTSKVFGSYEFRAVSLKEKAIGFESIGNLIVSSRTKTLFDCIYMKKYSVEMKKLVEAYRHARLTGREWKEFDYYMKHFGVRRQEEFQEIKRKIMDKEDD